MRLKTWESLPDNMKTEEVRPYYNMLQKKKRSIFFKRIFDVAGSLFLLVILSPLFFILAIIIKVDSPGPVFFRQERVTQYGRLFYIFKFRTMRMDAAEYGPEVTVKGDGRITRAGQVIRKYRLDELPQLLDIFRGTMSFVGTRPEVPRYTASYTPRMMATLLLPAGVTSLTAIFYAQEAELLDGAEEPDSVYIEKIMPEKMRYNLKEIEKFSCANDLKVIMMTVCAMCGKRFREEENGDSDQEGCPKRN